MWAWCKFGAKPDRMAKLFAWRADAACLEPSLRDPVVRSIPHRFEQGGEDAIAECSNWLLGRIAEQYEEDAYAIHGSVVGARPGRPARVCAAYLTEKKLLAIRHPERRHAEPSLECEALQQLILSLAGGMPEEVARASHVVELGGGEFVVVLVVEALPSDVRQRLYERLCAVEIMHVTQPSIMQHQTLSTVTPGSPGSSRSSPERVVEHRVQWAQCDACAKWRRIPSELEGLYANEPLDEGDQWYCSYLHSATGLTCQAPEEEMDGDERVLA